jgi:5'-nucleotidase
MNKKKSEIDIFENQPEILDIPKVVLDLDGVVRDFVGRLKKIYKKFYPEHEIKPITSRRLEEFFPIGENIYRFIKNGLVKEIMEEADPYPGSIEALNRWKNKFEIVVATAQPEISRAATFVWIGKFNIPTNEIVITFDKSKIEGIALLDDFIDNLTSFASTGRLAVCLDQPWNQEWQGPRVKNVDQFFEYVRDNLLKLK